MKQRSEGENVHMKVFGWASNPFSLKILPDVFVGCMKELESLREGVENNNKFSLLVGPTGSGKTTMIRHIISSMDKGRRIFFLSKPPKKHEDWVDIFTSFMGRGIVSRLISRSPGNIYTLHEWMNSRLGRDEAVLFVDECHEASMDTLEWLRTIVDHVDGISVVMSGLPVIEKMLNDGLETLNKRISNKIHLSNLTKAETREMIKKRIELHGGEDVKPFTQEAIKYIYDKTGGFPRDVLKLCNDLVNMSARNNISTIDSSLIEEKSRGLPERTPINAVSSLPSRQKAIISLLSKKGSMSPSQITMSIDCRKYKDTSNAVRSVNNVLKRLMKDGLVSRDVRGKGYVYDVTSKVRTLSAES